MLYNWGEASKLYTVKQNRPFNVLSTPYCKDEVIFQKDVIDDAMFSNLQIDILACIGRVGMVTHHL